MTKSRGLQKHPRKGEIAAFIEKAVAYTGNDCLPWPYVLSVYGYGAIHASGGLRTLAHRVICERVHGPAPEGKPSAAHSCGNRACVAPAHLRWASQKENAADSITHGTIARGAKLPHTRLKAHDIPRIRALASKMGRAMNK